MTEPEVTQDSVTHGDFSKSLMIHTLTIQITACIPHHVRVWMSNEKLNENLKRFGYNQEP